MTTSDDRVGAYLQRVLVMDASSDAAEMLRNRGAFLDGHDDYLFEPSELQRVEIAELLDQLRADFWQLAGRDLATQLSRITRSPFPDLVVMGEQLQRVAEVRGQLQTLSKDERLHPAFRKAILSTVIAKPTEANALREATFEHMRPYRNADYEVAYNSIQAGLRYIREHYRGVLKLESAWFRELRAYQPRWDLPDEGRDTSFGYAVMAVIGMTVIGIYSVIGWIF